MKRIIFLSTLFILNSFSQSIELPKSLVKKSVYHVKVKQLNNWSCGYNTLFNAVNLENFFGKPNIYSKFSKFSNLCLTYLKGKKKLPNQASTNFMLDELSKKLGLKNFYNFTINKKGQLEALFSTPTKISYKGTLSKVQVEKLMQEAIAKRNQKHIKDIKNFLDKSKGLAFVHFGCFIKVKGQGHIFLISLIKTPKNRRTLLIFDNLNSKITESSIMKKYIDCFCKTFSINNKESKESYKFSSKWPCLV